MASERGKRQEAAITIFDGAELDILLGPPPLIEGEDASAYEGLRRRIRHSVAPQDVIEELWVRDVIDLLWETLRLRRLKAKLMHVADREAISRVLSPLVERDEGVALQRGWNAREKATVKRVERRLAAAGLDREAVHAKTLQLNIKVFERIDHMIMQCEARRNMVLREIDRHRDALARRLREATATIEDAEFVEVVDVAPELEDCPT